MSKTKSRLCLSWFLLVQLLFQSSSTIAGTRKEIGFPERRICRTTVQGRYLLSDDNGYVCDALSLDPQSRCCPERGDKFSCQGCNVLSQCCNSYEFCVSCCLQPAQTQKDQVLKLKVAKPSTSDVDITLKVWFMKMPMLVIFIIAFLYHQILLDALKVFEWREVVMEEMRVLRKNETYEMVELPKEKKTVGCKWVFTPKFKADGSIERYKARLVAKGFTQAYGIDYMETFVPVAKLNSIRILLSVAVNLHWNLHQLDVKNVFLNGRIGEEVYMDPPPGSTKSLSEKVYKLKRSLYGLKQSLRAWFERFSQCIKKEWFKQGQADTTMFIKHSFERKVTIFLVYVDGIVLIGDDNSGITSLKEKLAEASEIKDIGSLRYFLSMEIARSKEGIMMSQRKYVLDLLFETGMNGCKLGETLVDPNLKLGEGEGDVGQYQRLVGKLIYLAHTRLDIAFVVSLVSQFMHSPRQEHLDAMYRILKYLESCPGKGL